MGNEKQGSKGGGRYVGGFLQLFDWHGKSRKKLFSNKSETSDGSEQEKRSGGSSPVTRLHHIDDHQYGRSFIKERNDYSCASSVTDDEGNGVRAPGVVARLMGLDCLPISDTAEPCSTPFDLRSLRDEHYRITPEISYRNQIMHSDYQLTDFDGLSEKPFETRPQKKLNRSMERFQTETLPPKSAKPISITHHKLLSPIKNHRFIPSKDAALIMEEAAKIIERGPQVSNRGKMLAVGSSSVPLKIRDLKEKMEASQRPVKLPEASQRASDATSFKYLKGQSLDKSWNGLEDAPKLRKSPHSDVGNSVHSTGKGKSVSLAIQAKVNVQKREGLSAPSCRSFVSQKETHEFKSTKTFKSQTTTQKSTQHKPSTSRTSGALRLNNQKQNCQANRQKTLSKPAVPKQQSRKSLTSDASFGRNKSTSKVSGPSNVGFRRTNLETEDFEREVSISKMNGFPRKKRSIERDFHVDNSFFSDTILVGKDEITKRPTVVINGQPKSGDDNRGKAMDVVSFTFTSPLKKQFPASHSSAQVVEKTTSFIVDTTSEKSTATTRNTSSAFSGSNMIGGDALSILLEQKIRELTYGIESSSHNSTNLKSGTTSESCVQDLTSDLSSTSTISREDFNKSQDSQVGLLSDEMDSLCESSFSSADSHKSQGSEELDKYNRKNGETRTDIDSQDSTTSVLESSSSTESCISFDSGDSYSMNGGNRCSSVEAQQVVNSNYWKKLPSMEADTELSDSASFPSNLKFGITDDTRSEDWELDYVKEILSNAELMFKDFTLGRAREIINPRLFDQLENRKNGSRRFTEEENRNRLRRKSLFDCVGECLDLRCRRYIGGGSTIWAKGLAMVRRKDWLANEVYKEITGWRSMETWMLDEVVDKDMSSQHGKWLEFETEEFEVGLDIEKRILSSLVDEIVLDVLF